MTEEAAIRKAVEKNPDLRIEKLDIEKATLTLSSAKSQGLPHLAIEAPATREQQKADYSSAPSLNSDVTTLEAGLGATASQAIFGGGSASAAILEEVDLSSADSTPKTQTVSLAFKQPLARGFAKGSEVRYRIDLAKYQYSLAREQFLEKAAEILSLAREAYWDWISAVSLSKIRIKQVEYAQNEMAYQRTRFSIGQASAIDTLGSHIEWLQAQSALVQAQRTKNQSARNLGSMLDTDMASAEIPSEADLSVASPPSAAELYEKAEDSSSSFRILEITQKSLKRQLSYQSNQRWPALDFAASYNRIRDDASALGKSLLENTTVSLVLSYQIFPRAETYEFKKLQKDDEANRLREKKAKTEIKIFFENLCDAWKTDSLRYALQESQLQMAQRRYEVMVEEEKLGKTDALTRMKVQNDLVAAEIEKLNQSISLKKIEIALDQSTQTVFQKFGIALNP